MTDPASKLQSKIKTYKQQIERPRRSRPSTWPSSGRPSRSWRRLRSAPSLPPSSKPHWIRTLSVEIRRKSDKIRNQTLRQYPHNCEDTEVVDFKRCSAAAQSPNFCFVTYNKPQA